MAVPLFNIEAYTEYPQGGCSPCLALECPASQDVRIQIVTASYTGATRRCCPATTQRANSSRHPWPVTSLVPVSRAINSRVPLIGTCVPPCHGTEQPPPRTGITNRRPMQSHHITGFPGLPMCRIATSPGTDADAQHTCKQPQPPPRAPTHVSPPKLFVPTSTSTTNYTSLSARPSA